MYWCEQEKCFITQRDWVKVNWSKHTEINSILIDARLSNINTAARTQLSKCTYTHRSISIHSVKHIHKHTDARALYVVHLCMAHISCVWCYFFRMIHWKVKIPISMWKNQFFTVLYDDDALFAESMQLFKWYKNAAFLH